jgi:Xaa-Pro aminopeptidase
MNAPALPRQDYFDRIDRMQKKVQESDLDAVIIVSAEAEPANVRYFTNYWPVFETAGVIIPKSGRSLLLIGPESVTLVEANSVIEDYRKLLEFRESSDPEYPDIGHDTFSSVFNEVSEGEGIKRLGLIGTNIMTVQAYEGILAAVPGAELIKADQLLRDMRMVKSPHELALLREAARIAGEGFEYVLDKIKPGMTEIQATAECIYSVMSRGAESPGYMIWVVSGSGTNQAIGKSRQKVIQKNELVQLQMGAMVDGYVSSFSRPIAFGGISQKERDLLEIGLEANALTHQTIKAGVEASDVVKIVHGMVRDRGVGHTIVYGPAHGIGMMECEWPFIESISNYKLQENMTFAVDTFLAEPNFGMRFEDTVAVTAEGDEQFCPKRREIIIL